MAEFFYRETGAGSARRMVGPFESEDEARRAARYKGLMAVEVLRRNGASYERVEKGGAPAQSAGSSPRA